MRKSVDVEEIRLEVDKKSVDVEEIKLSVEEEERKGIKRRKAKLGLN